MKTFLIAMATALSISAVFSPAQAADEAKCRFKNTSPKPSGPFAVIGDTQRTAGIERYFLLKELNDSEQEVLVASITNQSPAFLAHVGDLTFDGEREELWDHFENVMQPLCKKGVALLPAMGNHDYWGRNFDVNLHNMYKRFPFMAKSRWYVKAHGPLALVWLDSNWKKLGEDLWRQQMAWYKDTMARLQKNPEVRGIIVFTHHPPYTNSIYFNPPPEFTDGVLTPFYAAKKSLAFISGHVHGYEHFQKQGRAFIVSGGGGGPRAKTLLQGSDAREKDLFKGYTPRPFNYLMIGYGTRGIQIKTIGMNKDEKATRLLETINIPFNK